MHRHDRLGRGLRRQPGVPLGYFLWGYGPTGRAHLVSKEMHHFICKERIDTSEEAHNGDGTWINITGTTTQHVVVSVLNSKEGVLAAERRLERT